MGVCLQSEEAPKGASFPSRCPARFPASKPAWAWGSCQCWASCRAPFPPVFTAASSTGAPAFASIRSTRLRKRRFSATCISCWRCCMRGFWACISRGSAGRSGREGPRRRERVKPAAGFRAPDASGGGLFLPKTGGGKRRARTFIQKLAQFGRHPGIDIAQGSPGKNVPDHRRIA